MAYAMPLETNCFTYNFTKILLLIYEYQQNIYMGIGSTIYLTHKCLWWISSNLYMLQVYPSLAPVTKKEKSMQTPT